MKKIYLSALLIIFITGNCFTQNFFTGRPVISFSDPARAGRQVNTEIYYPANTAGNNVPVAAGTDKFSVVVFGHGFVIPVTSYGWLADSLVKYGYIVAMPTTEGSLSPSHENFGKDLSFLCTAITSLDNNAASFLYQRVRNKTAVSGHSMGGGASFLAAAGNSPADAVFNFAAAETNPSATAAAALTNRPALIFGGSSDCIVLPAVQQGMYTNVNYSCKTFININDALHCQFANNNGLCSFGQITSGCNSSSITPAIVFNKVTSLLLPFLDYYLKGICLRGEDFLVAYSGITGVIKQTTCISFPSCGVLPVNLVDFYGKVSGNKAVLSWKVSTEYNLKHYELEKSADGLSFKEIEREFPRGNDSEYQVTDMHPLPGHSFYRLRITDKDGSYNYSNIVKLINQVKDLAVTDFYPNPAINHLQVDFYSYQKKSLQYSIHGIHGQNIISGRHILQAGNSSLTLAVGSLHTGSYLLKITDENGNLIRNIQFIRGK